MTDRRTVDELSLEELEALVERRRRLERLRLYAENPDERRFRPFASPLEYQSPLPRGKNRPKSWRDRLLLVVEIVAALALLFILINSISSLQNLNQAVLQARSFTPSPVAGSGVQQLPGSSFPAQDTSSELPGGSSPPQPAPAALGVRLQSVAAVPVPTPGPRSPTRIVIPSINVDWPVVEGDSWEELKQGIGHHAGTANPGERGNLVLSGHNDVYGEPFRDLEKLEVGKEVLVYAGNNAFRYVIKAKRVVSPDDLSVLTTSRDPIITLITCTPYRVDTMRLIVIGELAP